MFDLRAGTVDLLQLSLKSADLDAVQQALQQRLDAVPGFFDGESLVVDLRRLPADTELDVAALASWLSQRGLRPLGLLANSAQADWLGPCPLPQLHSAERTAAAAEPPTTKPAASAQTVAATPQTATLVLDKPVRSGQRVYSSADLIALDMVSHGAEVIAAGHIHVYAPLRGRALAGAHGDASARIFSTCFEAELVAVAGVYRTADQNFPAAVLGRPTHVWLADDKLHVDALKLS